MEIQQVNNHQIKGDYYETCQNRVFDHSITVYHYCM